MHSEKDVILAGIVRFNKISGGVWKRYFNKKKSALDWKAF